MTDGDWPPGRWHGRWIWSGAPALEPLTFQSTRLDAESSTRFVCFRRALQLPRVPTAVPCRVTADSRYILWVNGIEVARGPVRANPTQLRVDHVDIAPFLREGDNLIAALGRFYGRATPWWRPVSATWGLGAGAFLFEARLEDESVVSDSSWSARVVEGMSTLTGDGISGMPIDVIDARSVPAGWHEAGFDDSGWEPATELGVHHIGFSGRHEPPTYPYGALPARSIAFLDCDDRHPVHMSWFRGDGGGAETDPVRQVQADEATMSPAVLDLDAGAFPLELPASDEVNVVHVDFGETVAGTFALEIRASEGAQIDLMAAESVSLENTLAPAGQHSGFRYIARGSDDRHETFDTLGLRYAGIAVRSSEPVTIRDIRVRERLYPRIDGPCFECSDPLLDQIWAVGRRTVDLCSFDAYIDCPSREQRAWTGDAVVHQMVDLTTNPDWRLARWHVEMAAASARPDGMLPMAVAGDIELTDNTVIPDWALHWVRMAHNLWRYTGDRELIGALLPAVERVIRWFAPYQSPNGLVTDVVGWNIIDWSAVTTTGASSAINGLWARALRDFASMARWMGDEGRAIWAEARQAEVRNGFSAFWDPVRSCYVDHIVDGERGRPVSQHGNAAAVVGGLVPSERIAAVVELLADQDHLVYANWLIPGSTVADGDDLYANPLYLFNGPPEPWWDVDHQVVAAQPFFRYVVHDAIAEAGRPELIPALCRDWEKLLDRCDTSLSETWHGGTYAHGWCATPTRDLITQTLGITPGEPGFARGRVAPRLGDLEWARGATPTPRGLLTVSVNRESIEIDSPVPVDVDVSDGQTVTHNTR